MKILLISIILVLCCFLGSEELFSAKVYHQESGELLYLHYNKIEIKDSLTFKTHYYLHPDSTKAVFDQVILKNQIPWKYKSEFYDLDEYSLLVRKNNKLHIDYRKGNEQKSKDFEFDDKLLSGPLFNDFVIDNWQALLTGKTRKFRLPAPDMLTTGGFYLKLEKDSPYQKADTVVLKMGISSIFLRLWIKPSYFVYEMSSKRLLEIHGLTILPNKVDGDWSRTTNADIYYEYKK